jgi:hypothetical protein
MKVFHVLKTTFLLSRFDYQLILFADLAADCAVFCDSNFILGIYILQLIFSSI